LLDYLLINKLNRFINELIKAIALAYEGLAKKAIGQGIGNPWWNDDYKAAV
jgi:hypothetical protein